MEEDSVEVEETPDAATEQGVKISRPFATTINFDPTSSNLDENFRLTNFSDSEESEFKIKHDQLKKLFGGPNIDQSETDEGVADSCCSEAIVRYKNCCVTPLKYDGLVLVQSSNLFYPMMDDPSTMARIACAGVLSDFYALGVTECDNILMFLTISSRMTARERDIIVPIMLTGFKDCARDAGAMVTGGQTVQNPWLSIGGAVTSVCEITELIPSDSAVLGDVLVLTKPLGTSIALTASSRMKGFNKRIKMDIDEAELEKAYQRAIDSMARLNRVAAMLMHKYKAHAAIAIGEQGLVGHAEDLVQMQINEMSFSIHNLPVIVKMTEVDRACQNEFQLLEGRSREISGGLLICISRHEAPAYCKEIQKIEGYPAWIVGIVEHGNRIAKVINRPRVMPIPMNERDGELW